MAKETRYSQFLLVVSRKRGLRGETDFQYTGGLLGSDRGTLGVRGPDKVSGVNGTRIT